MLRRLFAAALCCAASACFAADTLVLCPAGWQTAFDEWAKLRESQGHTIQIVAASDSVAGNQQLIRNANAASVLGTVVLVGDVTTPGAPPTGYEPLKVIRRWGPEPTVATDHVYADLTGDATPELAVGRIPSDTLEELRTYLNRVVTYERKLLTLAESKPNEPKPLRIVAAPGRFSPLVDRLLEATATRVLKELAPASTPLDVTYASPGSPYYPGVDRIHTRVLAGLTKPAVAWVYLGHGLPSSLDLADSPTGPRPLLSTDHLADLTGDSPPPVAAIFACYTGAVDARRDCLAEKMLATSSGPLTIIAASRVTMPYGNAVLGIELLREIFAEPREPTPVSKLAIGTVLMHAKRRSLPSVSSDELRTAIGSIAAGITGEGDLARERVEHIQAYNLLGDPLLTVRPTRSRIAAQPARAPRQQTSR